MSDPRRDILDRVKDGAISPEEALELLRAIETEAAPPPAPSPPAPPGTPQIRRVKVRLSVGSVDVVGDPSIAGADVEGPHTARAEDGELLIQGAQDWSEMGNFSFAIGTGRGHKRVHVKGPHQNRSGRIVVRMNPDLPLDVELDAGPLNINGVHGPISARVAAGPIGIEGFQGPIDVAVNAGAVRAVGLLTAGESRVRSDAGAIRIQLLLGSDVRIIGSAAIGQVVLPGEDSPRDARTLLRGRRVEALIGAGTGLLRVDTAMGSVHVSSADEPSLLA